MKIYMATVIVQKGVEETLEERTVKRFFAASGEAQKFADGFADNAEECEESETVTKATVHRLEVKASPVKTVLISVLNREHLDAESAEEVWRLGGKEAGNPARIAL